MSDYSEYRIIGTPDLNHAIVSLNKSAEEGYEVVAMVYVSAEGDAPGYPLWTLRLRRHDVVIMNDLEPVLKE